MGRSASRAERGTARARRRSASGAAAVEFALVSSIFFLVLFGIIQYGLYFNDSLSVRQGVREAARRGVVESFDFQSGCSSGSSSANLRCSTAKEIGALTGDPYVKVLVSSSPWQRGKALVVCAMVRSDGVLGLAPMPDGGWIKSKTQMSIEQETKATSWSNSEDSVTATGQDWTWCTP